MHNIEPILDRMFKALQSVKPQNAKLFEHLRTVMKRQGIYYPENTILYYLKDRVDKAMFISEGFITQSALNKKGNVRILSIIEANEIKAGPDFMQQTPSEFVIEATAGTFVAYITHQQMQQVYKQFPETRELAALIISSHNRKELQLKKLFSVKGIDLVEAFYKRYPKMLFANKILSNEKIASFLNIGVSTLIEYKNKLLDSGRLHYPEDEKQVNRKHNLAENK
jgi:CRP-like cAMP-binding protein